MTFGENIQASRVALARATHDLRSLLQTTCVELVETTDLTVKASCSRHAWAIARGLERIDGRMSRLPALPSAHVADGNDGLLRSADYDSISSRLVRFRADAFAVSDIETGDTLREVLDLLDVLADRRIPSQPSRERTTQGLAFEPPEYPGRPSTMARAQPNYRPDTIAGQLHDFAFRIELCATEVCAAMIAATPEAPLALHIDLARQVRDEMRHFELFMGQVGQRGHSADDFPIRFEIWEKFRCGSTITEWLVIEQRLGEGSALDTAKVVYDRLVDAQELEAAAVFEFVTADEVQHVKLGNRWLTELVGDEAAVTLLESSVLQALDNAGLAHIPKPRVEEELRRLADFSASEIERVTPRSSEN
ncbi:MAG: DUF455 family protein [Nocardioides sp.]